MRKVLNYLLGEDIVSKQSDKELKEALMGTAMCYALLLATLAAICIFG